MATMTSGGKCGTGYGTGPERGGVEVTVTGENIAAGTKLGGGGPVSGPLEGAVCSAGLVEVGGCGGVVTGPRERVGKNRLKRGKRAAGPQRVDAN